MKKTLVAALMIVVSIALSSTGAIANDADKAKTGVADQVRNLSQQYSEVTNRQDFIEGRQKLEADAAKLWNRNEHRITSVLDRILKK